MVRTKRYIWRFVNESNGVSAATHVFDLMENLCNTICLRIILNQPRDDRLCIDIEREQWNETKTIRFYSNLKHCIPISR